MADIVDKETRSRMMSGIRGKDTKPEVMIRKLLHSRGFRFRLHRKDLPGRPDIVLPRYRVAIFVQGCFWHGHENCHLFRLPSSRTEFWNEKIGGNKSRDEKNIGLLHDAGWRTLQIWECALKGKSGYTCEELGELAGHFIISSAEAFEIVGKK